MAKTILIIDDDADIRRVLRLTLEKLAGWNVLEAEDGEHGITLAASHCPDAILLDGMMPGLSGAQTVERLRQVKATQNVPVCMLTASGEAEFAGLKISGVLRKPFDPVNLPKQIAELLQW